MVKVSQGDIIWFDFDPVNGREQAGQRPALVISQTKYNEKREMIWICPITSKTKELRFRVLLDKRTKTQGDVICEQVRTVDLRAHKFSVIESIPQNLLNEVLTAVSAIIIAD